VEVFLEQDAGRAWCGKSMRRGSIPAGVLLRLLDFLKGLDNFGEAWSIASVYLQRYLEAAQLVFDNSIALFEKPGHYIVFVSRTNEKGHTTTVRLYARIDGSSYESEINIAARHGEVIVKTPCVD
jgi:hypothetical protein